MPDKKPVGRGVVDSIAALRQARYQTRGPGQFERKKGSPAKTPSVEQLRKTLTKVSKKRTKNRKRR